MKQKWTSERREEIKVMVTQSSQIAVANQLGVHRSRIHRLMNGKTYQPRTKKTSKISIIERINDLENQLITFKQSSSNTENICGENSKEFIQNQSEINKNMKQRIKDLENKVIELNESIEDLDNDLQKFKRKIEDIVDKY